MMEPWEDAEGHLLAEMATCEFCRFYHHSENICRRRAPSELVNFLSGFLDQVTPLFLPKVELYANDEPHWPHVRDNDWCGEFERGAALSTETLQEQKDRA